jgi:hypothetical protein
VGWNEPFVRCKFDVKVENLMIAKYFDGCIIPSILLGDKITKTYALPMPKRN